ncbi:MAG: FtsX-like permease family protein [Chloroflexi bacterium]|nr:FtsX-like permease family protein [Chloroflexota bacterium]
MHSLSIPKLIIKRLLDDWKLLLSIFIGIAIASTLVAGAPVYFTSLQKLGINTAIDRTSGFSLNFFTFAPNIPLTRNGIEGSEQTFLDALQEHTSELYRGHERYIKSPNYIIGIPQNPLPRANTRGRVSRGYLQNLSNMEQHITFSEGRMATDAILSGRRGPVLEVIIGSAQADQFNLKLNDEIVLTLSLGDPTRISAIIVGIMDATDPSEEYWSRASENYLNPAPLEDSVDFEVVIDPEEPPISLFITQESLIVGVGGAYPGSVVTSNWNVFVEKEGLKKWSIPQTRERLSGLENEISLAMPGSVLFTGIDRLLNDFERRSFFTSVPLLLLLTIMVLTVLYFLAMMVSYLVQSRENDVALLRSRGVSTMQLLRLYALEGLVLTVVAVVMAPFMAMGAVALAGALPYFREITDGALLPVEFTWLPFAMAAGTGLLTLAIFVVPNVIGARTGLVSHKLRSSRPPSIPFFQRYYIDVALLVLGGLIFWELRARGQFVSGGLFKDVQVNEALLLAPILFLIAVALLFMRFFPLFVRFLSGEAPTLLHMLTAATIASLIPIIVSREIGDGNGFAWLFPVATLAAIAGAYWLTHRTRQTWSLVAGLIVQAGLVALFVNIEPITSGEASFISTIALIAVVPAQIVFQLLKASAQVAPVWVSMSLWHMARNPLQYSWLVLLLVLVTGLGVLATTVGGTLDRSYKERILYDVAADIRVAGVPGYLARGTRALKEVYQAIPDVTSVSLGLRGRGTVGTTYAGSGFNVLALESRDFHRISWYRDDFSVSPLSGVMDKLQPVSRPKPIAIPEGTSTIGVWLKPAEEYANIFLWVAIQDSTGVVTTATMGETGQTEWHLMQADIPRGLIPPLTIAAIQIFEPVFGPAGTAGFILLDDLHATIGSTGEKVVLEDFEGRSNWTPLATSMLSSDSITSTGQDVYRGNAAGLFRFGKDTDRGIRGFYQSPSGGPLPIVVSSSFLLSTGTQVRDVLILDILGRLVPVVIQDFVDYFPTLQPGGGGFILVDLDILLRHLNILSPTSAIFPNELFIKRASSASEAVSEIVYRIAGSSDQVYDREALLTDIRLDPLITAGWKAMVALSVILIVFTSGLGYETYLLSFADHSRNEMGFLQSLGLSSRQMVGLLGLEHLAIVIIGLGLGTWAGFQMSAIMVSSIAVTETGQRVVPPFILTTDWPTLLLIYAMLAAVFIVSLYRLGRSMLHLDLSSISRVEG